MKTSIKVLHWTPRIICILAILFISLFALDSFEPNKTFWQQIAAFLIHLIPSFVLLALLLVAWKWEYIGGIIFTLIGLGFSPFIFLHNYKMNHSVWMSIGIIMLITVPFIIIGILFIVSHFKKRSQNPG
jgi:cytochrome b561